MSDFEKVGTIINELTTSGYVTEDEACSDFDEYISSRRDLFVRNDREVVGEYLWVPPGADPKKTPRVDRILIPSDKLLAAGWSLGPIVIEMKRSNIKLGPMIAQALDYRAAVFKLWNGFRVHPSWVFLFPVDKPVGDVASILAQQRIGTATITPKKWRGNSSWSGLKLMCASLNVLETERAPMTVRSPVCGWKQGSR